GAPGCARGSFSGPRPSEPPTHESRAYAPAVTAAPLALTPAQRTTIYRTIIPQGRGRGPIVREHIVTEPVAPAPVVRERVAPPGSAYAYAVGSRVADAYALAPMPQAVGATVPCRRPYRYMVINKRPLVCDPASGSGVAEVDEVRHGRQARNQTRCRQCTPRTDHGCRARSRGGGHLFAQGTAASRTQERKEAQTCNTIFIGPARSLWSFSAVSALPSPSSGLRSPTGSSGCSRRIGSTPLPARWAKRSRVPMPPKHSRSRMPHLSMAPWPFQVRRRIRTRCPRSSRRRTRPTTTAGHSGAAGADPTLR